MTKKHALVLVMIVKDEAHIIHETLASVAPYIDFYVISDTGSTDTTCEIITEFFDERDIDGRVFHDTWVDFGTNRSLVLSHAKPYADMCFMIDADDLLCPPESSSSLSLVSQLDRVYYGYQLTVFEESNPSFTYWRTQIFHTKKGAWKYNGVLHEYPTPVDVRCPGHVTRVDGWRIMSRRRGSRNSGMSKTEKYARDAVILRREVDRHPHDSRNVFYLANSYRDSSQDEMAIRFYTMRTEMGGWVEEVYYAYYMIGSLYLKRNDLKNGTRFCLKAFQVCPDRAESMHALVRYHILCTKNFDLARRYNEKITTLPLPRHHGLFLETAIYTTYARAHHQLLSFLCFQKNVTYTDDTIARLARIPLLSHLVGGDDDGSYVTTTYTLPSQRVPRCGDGSPYRVFNPCLAKGDCVPLQPPSAKGDDGGDMMVLVRTSNYDQHYKARDADGIVRTVNFLCTPDMSRVYTLVDVSSFDRTRTPEQRLGGYEDLRLFFFAGRWCFVANTPGVQSKVVFGRLAEEPVSDTVWGIEYVVRLRYVDEKTTEKNWVPRVHDPTSSSILEIVYSPDPHIVLSVDILSGMCIQKDWVMSTTWALPTYPVPSPRLRHSTPYVRWMNGWLAVCHVVYCLREFNQERVYYHFFVHVSETHVSETSLHETKLSRIRFSPVFHFEECAIEYAMGLVITQSSIIVSYSTRDQDAKQVEIPEERVRTLFEETGKEAFD
jgi:glycosyltransferase involved in cell wall biosynthesis